VENHIAAGDVSFKVVTAKPHTLAEEPQYLHSQASRQHYELPNNLPAQGINVESP
jgi:hypothetical protein